MTIFICDGQIIKLQSEILKFNRKYMNKNPCLSPVGNFREEPDCWDDERGMWVSSLV